MTKDEDSLFHQFSLVQLSVKPVKMLVWVIPVQENPKVEVIAKVTVDRQNSEAWSQQHLKYQICSCT